MCCRLFKYGFILVAVSLVFSCSKSLEESVTGGEVRLHVSHPMSVTTKVTPVTLIPSTLYWGASTGSSGSETPVWACVSAAVADGEIATGKYQESTPVAYNYYVSNQSFTIGAAATTLTADGSTDVIVGSARSDESVTPSVSLQHIYSRTGSFSMTTQPGYAISDVSWTIVGKSAVNGIAGTYNLSTMSWTATSAVLASTAVTSSSDLWLIPAVYTVSCQYTLTKGDYTETFIKSGDVTFIAGKITNISGVASGGDATEITFLISFNDWEDYDAGEIALAAPKLFGGVRIAPGNLYYDGSAYRIADHPLDGLSRWGGSHGMQADSFYHSWNEMAAFFSSNGAGTGNTLAIDNLNNTVAYDGKQWRMPTKDEFASIFGTTRAGSKVNGSGGKHWTWVVVSASGNGLSTSAAAAGTYPSGYQAGYIVFPDDAVITSSASISVFDGASETYASITLAQLDELLDQGCVFFPEAGRFKDSSWEYSGSIAFYWVSTCTNESGTTRGDALIGSSASPWTGTNHSVKATNWFTVRLVNTP